jgi:hypothetical protein
VKRFVVCVQVVAVLGLLQAAEGHLGTGNVLLGVLEVLELEQSQQVLSSENVIGDLRGCRHPSGCPCPCWRRSKSNPRPHQSFCPRDREGWV